MKTKKIEFVLQPISNGVIIDGKEARLSHDHKKTIASIIESSDLVGIGHKNRIKVTVIIESEGL